jgi:pimeloyl-ACP methyl ester carboxylesterase
MEEQIQIRVYGDASKPTLIYLPGLHGDWTLVGGFRRAIADRVQFVEMTYPRTLTWSLEDYAREIEGALEDHGITSGWLLGESFGSQVVWPMVERKRFKAEGVILAGGFVRHPMQWGVRLAERIAGGISLGLITLLLFGYAKVARFRYRHSPETRASIHEFIARRTELDRQAAKHRLRLVAESDLCRAAQEVNIPVYGLSGIMDPVVPWFWSRSWLKKNCASLRDYKILWGADHNVLGTAPDAAAEQVSRWLTAKSEHEKSAEEVRGEGS